MVFFNTLLKKLLLLEYKSYIWYLADPGRARGCSTNTSVINWSIKWVGGPFPPTALRRRQAQTLRDSRLVYNNSSDRSDSSDSSELSDSSDSIELSDSSETSNSSDSNERSDSSDSDEEISVEETNIWEGRKI